MIHNVSFRRKVVYLCVIALLLFPLYMIGRPATGDLSADPDARPGGTLAQLRASYGLSQAELGDIDPASESMKLATLGMRGVAANILWSKANYYKKTENWEALVATVNQMSKLQPNFVSVWEFQSHNLTYNISVEQDDYRFRYLWVKKGIEFLIKGTRYNRREPRLFWTLGWYTGQKFGRADEHKQFRRLFRDDDSFHLLLSGYVDVDGEGRGPDGRPDHWLVSRLWYLLAYDLVDNQGATLRGKTPHIFYADGPKARMNHASAIESEGFLDEKAAYAWQKAGEEWKAFGERLVPTSWGTNIRLNDMEALQAEAKRLRKELNELAPGVRAAIREEKLAKLTEQERQVLAKSLEDLASRDEYQMYMRADYATKVTDLELAERSPSQQRAKAYRMAKRIAEAETAATRIDMYRRNVNFTYWKTRCDVEQLPEAVAARRHVYQAKRLQREGELEKSEAEFEKAWELWSDIISQNQGLLGQEQLMADDLFEDLEEYVKLLGQLEKRISTDFPLIQVLEMFDGIPDHVAPENAEAKDTESVETETPADGAAQSDEDPPKSESVEKDPATDDSAD